MKEKFEDRAGFKKEDFRWTDSPVIGYSLLLMGGEIDSFNKQIEKNTYYLVGKHKTNGKVAIIPIEKNN